MTKLRSTLEFTSWDRLETCIICLCGFFVAFKCHWSSVEMPLKCHWSAFEVPTANSHSDRPSPANSPIIHSRLVQNCTFKQSKKNSKNHKTLPFYHHIGCQCVGVVFTKIFHYYYCQVLPQLKFLSFVAIWVDFWINLEFLNVVTIWVFEFGHIMSFCFFSQFEFLSFVTF